MLPAKLIFLMLLNVKQCRIMRFDDGLLSQSLGVDIRVLVVLKLSKLLPSGGKRVGKGSG